MATHRTTIDQHQGTHPATGLRITQAYDVVTEVDCADDDEDGLALHAACVALAQLDAEPRAAATEAAEALGEPTPEQILEIVTVAREAHGEGDDAAARAVSRALGDDGQRWLTPAGVRMDALIVAAGGARRECDGGLTRYVMRCGGVIVEADGGWDLGYPNCMCWQGAGHDDGCAATLAQAASEHDEDERESLPPACETCGNPGGRDGGCECDA